MCEWLSYGDWCDVKLLCGGRAFSAHRVVLASVSTFLRRLLLSCPVDESPTFIVLPEFDLDAMSSVLYYIYNGEVIVQKQKLKMFLDIIRAMQIFIDNQYLPQDSDKSYDINLECHSETEFYKSNIFTLRFENAQDQTYVNLKKSNKVLEVRSKYLVSDPVSDKDLVLSRNPSKDVKCPLVTLKSAYEDRKKNSFLRDLFLETYPRNGNVNGLRAGVLAISNECYRAPASVLLTNANGNHLSADNILLDSYKKTSELISDSPTVLQLQRRCTRSEPDYGECSKSFCDLSFKNNIRSEQIKNKYICETEIQNVPKNDWMSHIPITPNKFVQLGVREQFLSGLYVPSMDYSISSSIFDTVKSMQAYRTIPACSTFSNNGNKQSWNEMDKIPTSKTTILNHVLDSPWCPRIPNSFKPFRRKEENNSLLTPVTVKKELTNISDSNNNVNTSYSNMEAVNKKESVTSTEIKNAVNVLQTNSDVLHFKCSHCNQVFISRDLLAVHMRRHSTNNRYTCGECDKTFSQLRNFKYHMSIHRGTREFAATCTVCGKYFNDRGYLSSHMKIHRNRKEYKCTLCPKSFNQRVAYNMHVRIHTGVKPHVCEQCGKAFSRKMLLKQHQRTHSGERPYACPHCDKRFADRSNMTLHLRLHTGIKPFSCTLCPKSFTKKHHLKSHLNFHTGSKPYSCPRCKLAFTQSSNMRTHLKKCRAPEPMPNTETL